MSQTYLANSSDDFPLVPETRPIEPLVQCGVLYLGTAPSSPGLRALDSIQEPFSHRYPVDGTNTVRGIDAVLSIYDNGIQLAFTRQPHAVVFFPLASLVYCASVRFSIVANDHSSLVDWRFMPLDQSSASDESKHPPLFCAVIHRTHLVPGDECHCFITKSTDAAIALVRNITQIYASIKRSFPCSRSPVFYQLDRFGRRLSEISGVIYLSPAHNDTADRTKRRHRANHSAKESANTDYLSDSSLDGFFYRTEASLIEEWQLWDDDQLSSTRPRPPASPFGLHEGLYHDDTTQDIQRYLRRMEDEEQTCSCASSTSTSSSSSHTSISSSPSTNSSPSKSEAHSDQFDASIAHIQVSSFEPERTGQKKTSRKAPIIIEKVQPNPLLALPILHPKLPRQRQIPSIKSIPLPDEEVEIAPVPLSDPFNISYQVNERGEKITKDGNRLMYMDVVRPAIRKQTDASDTHQSPKKPLRTDRRRSSHIPIIDIQSLERLFQEKHVTERRTSSRNTDRQSNEHHREFRQLIASDMLPTIDDYFQYDEQHSSKSNRHEDPVTPTYMQAADPQRKSIRTVSSVPSSTRRMHQRSHSIMPSTHYGQQSPVSSHRSREAQKVTLPLRLKPTHPVSSTLTNEQLNEFVSNIYGTAGSVRSSSSSLNRPKVQASTNESFQPTQPTSLANHSYASAFRYMQSSINPNLLREYRGINS